AVTAIEVDEAIRTEGEARRGIKSVEDILSVERTGAAARIDAISITDRGAVKTAGYSEAPGVSKRQSVGWVKAPGLWKSTKIDPRIKWRSVAVRCAVLESVYSCNRVVRID